MRATRYACYVALVHPTQPEQSDFARLLAGIQKDAKLSYQQVADAAGVNRSQVWRWINSGSAPGYEPVRRLAAHLLAAYPQLADAAAELLPAAGYQVAPVTAAGGITLPSLATTGDTAADEMETAVVTAALPRREREVWAEMRASLHAIPAGEALFSNPRQAALWPEGSAPIDLTPEAIAVLDSIAPGMLFTARSDILAASMELYPWHERVRWAAAGRAVLRRPTQAARRAG